MWFIKFCRWVWARLADIGTGTDLLDWVGWKGWLLGIGSGAVTAGLAAFLDAPAWARLGFGLAGSLMALGLLTAWQNWKYQRYPKGGNGPLPLGHNKAGSPEYIGLHAAVTVLFELQRGKYVLQRARQNAEAGKDTKSDIQIVAEHIASHIPIYGRLHDGQKNHGNIEIIQKSAFESHRFDQTASRLTHLFYESSYYYDLHVKKDELEAFQNSELFSQGFYEG